MPLISSKNQITLPVEALRAAGLGPGDDVHVVSAGPGRIEVVRDDDLVEQYAGSMAGIYSPGYLEELRDEWR